MLETNPKNQFGYTLPEVLIILVIVGILVAFAVPNYNIFIKNQAIVSTSNEIMSTLQTARSEAIKRGLSVTACFKVLEKGKQCQDPGITTNNINYIYVFVDTNNNNDRDSGEEILFTSNSLNQNIIYKQNKVDARNLGGSIKFDSRGKAEFEAGLSRKTAYLAICDDRKDNASARLITISQTGRTSISSVPVTNSFVDC